MTLLVVDGIELHFSDWAFAGNTAQRTGDTASFQRADTFAGLMENVLRYESKYVNAADSARAAQANLDRENAKTFGQTPEGSTALTDVATATVDALAVSVDGAAAVQVEAVQAGQLPDPTIVAPQQAV
jgi:hypothetical protein